jgi:pyruvate formate lyase activating enzyme
MLVKVGSPADADRDATGNDDCPGWRDRWHRRHREGVPADVRRLPLLGAPGEPRSLQERLLELTAPAALVQPEGDGLRCAACAHRCRLSPGQAGVCGVRANVGGELRAPWGYIARRNVRAVETNTVFHVKPGAAALTFGMYGCDLRCPYCHNWQVSQALREPGIEESPTPITAAALVSEAVGRGCRVLCAAYNEPMLAAEWVAAVFAEARRAGLLTAVISDGHTTRQALSFLRPVTDVFRVDLKAGTAEAYRLVGARLQPVLDAIATARELGYWVEVVTLVAPGISDELADLRALAGLLGEIDPDIPWHLNGFVPRYRMKAEPATPSHLLIAAAGSAYARGLRFVYVGNAAGAAAAALNHTRCPECHAVLVERADYRTVKCHLAGAACPDCRTSIPGLWEP